MIQLHIISTLAAGEVVPNIGQIDKPTQKQLDKMVKAGDIAKWRGKWFPVAGSPYGIGPDKTCYGSLEAALYFGEFKGSVAA